MLILNLLKYTIVWAMASLLGLWLYSWLSRGPFELFKREEPILSFKGGEYLDLLPVYLLGGLVPMAGPGALFSSLSQAILGNPQPPDPYLLVISGLAFVSYIRLLVLSHCAPAINAVIVSVMVGTWSLVFMFLYDLSIIGQLLDKLSEQVTDRSLRFAAPVYLGSAMCFVIGAEWMGKGWRKISPKRT